MTDQTHPQSFAELLEKKRDEHLAQMADWAEGRRSYTNYHDFGPVWTYDVIAMCDAAEVQKHGAAAMAYGFLAALHERPTP